eukprot:gene8721-11783_t
MESSAIVVVDSGQFRVLMQQGQLSVVSVPSKFVSKLSWWLVRQFGLRKSSPITSDRNERFNKLFNSVVLDDDGLSIVCCSSWIPTLCKLMKAEEFTVSPQTWRALIIDAKGSATEFPGAVYFLANTLSSAGLSILHISTFESEIFLIQEPNIDIACKLLKETQSPTKVAELMERAYRINSTEKVTEQSAILQQLQQDLESTKIESTDNVNLDMNWLATSPSPPGSYINNSSMNQINSSPSAPALTLQDGFTLCVLPNYVYLARLNPEFEVSQFAPIIIDLLLYDARFNTLEKECVDTSASFIKHSNASIEKKNETSGDTTSANKSNIKSLFENLDENKLDKSSNSQAPSKLWSSNRATFMWGLWESQNEVTFLLDNNDIDKFPQGSLTISPQRWRIIKLCGRPIAFDETGVVTEMSKIESSIPSLNISTSTTNCTLVPEELLESALQSLANAMKCPVRESR